jgi:tetraacyldisaccharide 4'-kinase
MYEWLHRVWYEGNRGYLLLMPLSWVYALIVLLRRGMYRLGWRGRYKAPVPVIIIGNLTAGGTGKTPTTIWLARELAARGFTPGIVSRGYAGTRAGMSMRVDAASDPALVGDEPVLIARQTGFPVVVDRNRSRAVEMLLEDGVDTILADDGLQHYRLERSYEICVIDGARGLGNRRLIPAGPLRETIARLAEVDQVLVNGELRDPAQDLTVVEQNAIRFDLVASEVTRLDGSPTRPIERFSGKTVHAVAAIGNPRRFFDLLRSHGMQVIEHAYPDHACLSPQQLRFGDQFDILMTEKDAVKLGRRASGRLWSVPVRLQMNPVDSGPWLEQIESRLRSEQGIA